MTAAFGTAEQTSAAGKRAARTNKLKSLCYRVDKWFEYDPPPTPEQVSMLVGHIVTAAAEAERIAS